MKEFVLAVAIATSSIPSFAWGDREQGILTGIIISSIFNHARQQVTPPQQIQPQQPNCGYNVYCQPIQQPNCRSYPQYDYYGRVTHYITYCSNQ